jgi:hypothetical protein
VRRAVRVLAARGDEPGAARGLALLRALGVASPLERSTAPPHIDLACAVAMRGLDAPAEALRKAVATLAALAGGSSGAAGRSEPAAFEGTEESPAGDDAARPGPKSEPATARAAWLAAAVELVGAPELLALEAPRLRGALEAMLAEARDGRLGRRGSRAVRSLDTRLLDRLDLAAWRNALRALAWARATDALGGDLGAVLAAIAAGAGAPDDVEELAPWLGEAPEALPLLRALEQAWLAPRR